MCVWGGGEGGQKGEAQKGAAAPANHDGGWGREGRGVQKSAYIKRTAANIGHSPSTHKEADLMPPPSPPSHTQHSPHPVTNTHTHTPEAVLVCLQCARHLAPLATQAWPHPQVRYPEHTLREGGREGVTRNDSHSTTTTRESAEFDRPNRPNAAAAQRVAADVYTVSPDTCACRFAFNTTYLPPPQKVRLPHLAADQLLLCHQCCPLRPLLVTLQHGAAQHLDLLRSQCVVFVCVCVCFEGWGGTACSAGSGVVPGGKRRVHVVSVGASQVCCCNSATLVWLQQYTCPVLAHIGTKLDPPPPASPAPRVLRA